MFETQLALNTPSAKIDSILAPTKGWNKRDPLSSMKDGYAVVLDNWWPLPYSIQLRKGSANYVTGITDGVITPTTVNTLITYRPKSGGNKLFGFSGTRAFDVSSAGVVGAAVLTGLTNDTWNCINFATVGGSFLLCLNAVDKLRAYDGTNWEAIDNASVMFAITGVTTSNLLGVFAHQSRLYYIEKGSLNVWYPAVGALGGALTKLDFSSVFAKGGSLLAGGTWSTYSGDGRNDYACFLSSEGELAVYQGTDPSDDTLWALVGVFAVGTPIGKRCLMKYAGDLLILTVDGIVSATNAFQKSSDEVIQLAITDTIQGAVAESGPLYLTTYGWQMLLYASASMLLVNVPEAGGAKQWVMNTVTKAWARFLGWNTTCFELFNNEIYFGGLGVVTKAWTGPADNGVAIVAEVVPAFSYYKLRGIAKQWTMLRPNIEWDQNPLSMKFGFDVDFRLVAPTQEVALMTGSSGGIWDSGTWDNAVWGGDLAQQSEWYGVDGFGLAGAPHMIFESASSTARITSFDVVYAPGSLFG